MKDRWGGTALTDAIREEHTNVQTVLQVALIADASSCPEERIEQMAVERHSGCALQLLDAAAGGDIEGIFAALASGAELNHRDVNGRTALHLACSENRADAVELLLRLRARPDVEDRWGNAPLQEAVQGGHAAAAAALERAGICLSSREAARAAHALASRGDVGGLEALLGRGVPVDAADAGGRSPLHSAAAAGRLGAVGYLVARSADVNRSDCHGESPLAAAAAAGHAAVAEALRCAGARPAHRPHLRALPATSARGRGLAAEAGSSRENRAGAVLLGAFPPAVAEAMMAGRAPAPVDRECVSVMFSKIVGFTTISSRLRPAQVSALLNRLFARFDGLAAAHGVQKVQWPQSCEGTGEGTDLVVRHLRRLTRDDAACIAAANRESRFSSAAFSVSASRYCQSNSGCARVWHAPPRPGALLARKLPLRI